MVRILAIAALSCCLCAFVCGHAFTPRIRNLTDREITVTVHYRDRSPEHFELGPNEFRGAPAGGLEIVELAVDSGNGERIVLKGEDIARMIYPLRSQFGTEVRISESGVVVRSIDSTAADVP
jgi:hypothetical protein